MDNDLQEHFKDIYYDRNVRGNTAGGESSNFGRDGSGANQNKSFRSKQWKSNDCGYEPNLDHTPHPLFVELDELEDGEWVEKARWIKYEEDLVAETGKWGQPHVSSLTFRSLINVRKSLESGVMLLDLLETDFNGVVDAVVNQLFVDGFINENKKPDLVRILSFDHKYVEATRGTFGLGMKRNHSIKSVQMRNGFSDKDDMESGLRRRSGSKRNIQNKCLALQGTRNPDILSCLEEDTEGCITLVGSLEEGDRPISAFVRLANGILMHSVMEVELPVRFINIILVPRSEHSMDPYEIGRSISTLMADKSFQTVCYTIKNKAEILHAINVFLDDSVVLPPGDWNKQKLLAMAEILDMKKRQKEWNETALDALEVNNKSLQPLEPAKEERNPLEWSRTPFGGVFADIKHRYPQYLSDLKDGLYPQCVGTIFFIYFACLSAALAFGGLLALKTKNNLGATECLLITSVTGIIFSIFSCAPLVIIGPTGPLVVFDEALFNLSKSLEVEYLPWRFWVSIWCCIVSVFVALFQGSVLAKWITRFTKEIYAALICLIFLVEAIQKLVGAFVVNPLFSTDHYCNLTHPLISNATLNSTLGLNATAAALSALNLTFPLLDTNSTLSSIFEGNTTLNLNLTSLNFTGASNVTTAPPPPPKPIPTPNTALLVLVLMFGTFGIAYGLKIFRNSHIFGRNVRRALGDFGIPIAIVLMTLLDLVFPETAMDKLVVPAGLQVTDSAARGWIIPPLGFKEVLPVWAGFAAILPGILLYIILFMETEIVELLALERTKGAKGVGLHFDIFLISAMNVIAGIIGAPFMCAATVRAVVHMASLVVMSPAVAPGDSPKMIGVRDQRVTAFCVALLIGLSVLMSPILKLIPMAVLFGVFLYMGVSGTQGLQFTDRVFLFLMPIKHHPKVSYVKRVKTWRMHIFTGFQIFGLATLWIVRSTPASIAFPFFVIALLPLRQVLRFIFSPQELEDLDGVTAGKDLSGEVEDEPDFYVTAAQVPVIPERRKIMGITVPNVHIPGFSKK